MAVPNTFASATSAIPLANLDANFAYYDAGFSLSGSAITFAGAITLTSGTANGVPYLNASKVLTSGAVLTFDGTILSSTRFAGALNGTVGATTASTGAFTTLSASSTVSGAGFSTYLASPPAIGGTAAAAGAFTTLTTSSTVTLNGGTANGVAYLNGSKVLTSGPALTFNGTAALTITGAGSSGNGGGPAFGVSSNSTADQYYMRLNTAKQLTFYGYDLSNTGNGWSSLALADGGKWAFYADNSEQMRLTSTGLGIGTTSPSDKLDVFGGKIRHTLAGGGVQLVLGNSLNAVSLGSVQASGDASLAFYTNTSTERMRLDSAGNLGLGVTPSAWADNRTGFQVGKAALWNVSTINSWAGLSANMYHNAGGQDTYIGTGESSQYLQVGGAHAWYTAPSGTAGNPITFSQKMTLDASGNLGVGTTSPAYKLDVNGAISMSASAATKLSWNYSGAYSNWIECGGVAGNNYMRFATGNTEVMRLDSAGNLGLGVTPSAWTATHKAYQLQGGGSLYNNGADGYLNLANNFYYDGADWRRVTAAPASYYLQASGGHLWGYVGTGTANSVCGFPSAQMALDSSGNLGLGVTPSAWNSAWKALQFGPVGAAFSNSGNAIWSGNEYLNTGGTPTYITTQYALRYRQDVGSGYHAWFTAPSGTAGATISFTQAMTLDASGNLLVGATAVGNGGKLYVNGSISIGTTTGGTQSSMAKDTTQLTTSVSTSATTIFTDISSGMSSASAGYFIIYGHNNAGAGFMDVVVAKASGTPVVVSSSVIQGIPSVRTYSVSSFALQLAMTSGTYNVNLKATVLGYPF